MTGRAALDSTRNALQVQITPYYPTTPRWAHTKMAVTEAGVGIGIGFPQGCSKLHVVGDVRIDGVTSANHPALAHWVHTTTQTNWAFNVQPPHQPHVLIVERIIPNTDNLIAEGVRLDGSVSVVLTWRVEQGAFASTPIVFSDGRPYVSGRTLGGTTDPLTVRWGVTKGVYRTDLFGQTLQRHHNTPGLTDMLCHAMHTVRDIAPIRVRIQKTHVSHATIKRPYQGQQYAVGQSSIGRGMSKGASSSAQQRNRCDVLLDGARVQ